MNKEEYDAKVKEVIESAERSADLNSYGYKISMRQCCSIINKMDVIDDFFYNARSKYELQEEDLDEISNTLNNIEVELSKIVERIYYWTGGSDGNHYTDKT